MSKKIIIFLMLLVLIVPVVALADDGNLLENGDFEGGLTDLIPDDWFTEMWFEGSEYTDISAVDIEGNTALKITNYTDNDARICQSVKVKGGKTYKLSGYIYTYGVTDGQGANLSFENLLYTTEGVYDSEGEWQYVEIYGKTGFFQQYVKIFVRLGGYGALSSGEAYYDNITFELVDDVPDGVEVVSLKQTSSDSSDDSGSGIDFLFPAFLISVVMAAIFWLLRKHILGDDDSGLGVNKTLLIAAIFGLGLIIRVILALTIRGYPNDISCWIGWSQACANDGLFGIYQSDIFLDYPPGYLYILTILGYIMKLLGSVKENVYWLLVKIPPILADVGLSYIIYRTVKKNKSEKKAIIYMAIYFLSPVVILNSSAWGQIDGILALFVALYVLALYDRKFWQAGIFLAVGVLMKVQMVLFAPLYLTAAWSYFKEKKGMEFVKHIASGVLTGVVTLLAFGMPFFIGEDNSLMSFIGLYTGALDTYSTVSLNAANIWALLGGMWTPMENLLIGGISYSVFMNIGLGLSIAVFLVIGFLDTKKEHIFMHAALLITGIFMLGGKMHERYMFTALILLMLSVLYTNRKSSYILLIVFSVTQFLNTSLVLANDYIYGYDTSTTFIALLAVAGYAYMIYVSVRMIKNKEEKAIKMPVPSKIETKEMPKGEKLVKIESEGGFFKKIKKIDVILMAALTVVYAIIAFINLGSLTGPETNFKTVTSNSEVIIDFGEEVDVSELWFFRGKSSSGASFYVSYSDEIDGEYETLNYVRITYGGMYDTTEDEVAEMESIMEEYGIEGEYSEQILFTNYPDILKWFQEKSETTARYVKITFENSGIYMFEMGFKDTNGDVIPIENIYYDTDNEKMPMDLLFDEQDTIPDEITFMNGTYFDEIYHAGTAWEHLNYVDPYETTHPPLGKVIMSWGIAIFGTNTFGWRFMGAFVGVLMVPVMYLLGLVLFKKSRYAFIAAFLFTFDFMHFVQTRIATIDSYGVFFIMLMYLFMAIYYHMNYNKEPLIKTLIPLGLSGIFFGMGAASKWICLYAGAGLAVIFFYTMYKRWNEYMYAKYDGRGLSGELIEEVKKKYVKKTVLTLLWCVLFFIIIPIGIYVASYIPIMKIGPAKDLAWVWQNQINMFKYHSNLDSTHSFASPWYEWPFIIKPMWYYSNDAVRGTGYMGSIAAFGNPAVWWLGAIAMVYLVIDSIKQRKFTKAALFVLLSFLSQYLPWVLITRSTFIYHYFASVPFIVCAIVYAIKTLEERYKMNRRYVIYYLIVVLLLFAFFYPVLSGTVIPSSYGKLMKWMSTWWFTY